MVENLRSLDGLTKLHPDAEKTSEAPLAEKDGLTHLFRFLYDNQNPDRLRSFKIHVSSQREISDSRANATFSYYLGSDNGDNKYLGLTIPAAILKECSGDILVVPHSLSKGSKPYHWLDFGIETENGQPQTFSSCRLIPDENKKTNFRSWHGVEEQILADYIHGRNEISFDDLTPLDITKSSKTSFANYHIAGEADLTLSLFENPIAKDASKIRLTPQRIEGLYEWIDINKVDGDILTPIKSYRLLKDTHTITTREWNGPEKQLVLDYLAGDSRLSFENLKPIRLQATKSGAVNLGTTNGKTLEFYYRKENVSPGDELILIPRQKLEGKYQYLDLCKVDPLTKNITGDIIGSGRIKDNTISQLNWLGLERQLLKDFTAGQLSFDDLENIPFRVGKSNAMLNLWKEDSKKVYLVLSKAFQLKEGDQLQLEPEELTDMAATFLLKRENIILARYSYNTVTKQFVCVDNFIINEGVSMEYDQVNDSFSDANGEAWVSRVSAMRYLGLGNDHVRLLFDGVSTKKYKIAGTDKPVTLYSISELEACAKERNIDRNRTHFEALANQVRNFTMDIAHGENVNAKDFRRLIELFGTSRTADLLYKSHPEFKGVPIDRVNGFLADYLGDFLTSKSDFHFDDLQYTIEYLSDPDLKVGLTEVIKDSALSYLLSLRKEHIHLSDRDLIDAYLNRLDGQVSQLKNSDLQEVANEIRKYWVDIFSLQKPNQIVDQLKFGRAFPDISQLINIKEIMDKKRMMIADEMGLGKSASAILAKEVIGSKQALIVTPNNVVSTWIDYLSDKVGADGKQIGYFKPGQVPKVAIIESMADFDPSKYTDFDYLIISHEKITEASTASLSQLPYDMLIADEVHGFKNIEYGVRSKGLITLAEKIQQRDGYLTLLSGTPVPNKVEDVAMLLKLLYPERFSEMNNRQLVRNIINGDIVDIRNLLIPRMQMKELTESIEMPPLYEEIIYMTMSPEEKEVYDVLMEDDELDSKEKMRLLREFLINPRLLDATPGIEGTKVREVGNYLGHVFQEKEKVVLFVNNFIEGVIRGDDDILRDLNLPEDISVRFIHGEIDEEERRSAQAQLNSGTGKTLLVVSGQTAEVGVDFSKAEEVIFYNQPWTKFSQLQQLGRVYREGLPHPLKATTFLVRDTIESGIAEYIDLKYKAIQKLLKGVPITDIEKELLGKTESLEDEGLEVNPELAAYYLSAWGRMQKMFQHVKEIGETDFKKFVSDHGKEYADCYVELGNRSYQANACRVSGAIIDKLLEEKGGQSHGLGILDIASGPEMLKRHIADQYQSNITSLDINRSHFSREGGKRIVGSFSALPVQDKSIDVVNLSLALHYTAFSPSNGVYERLQVLQEMNRVLKPGGKAVVNLMYNMDFRSQENLKEVLDLLGFNIVDDYSGYIQVGDTYKSQILTLQKYSDSLSDPRELMEYIGRELSTGIKFKRKHESLRDSRHIIEHFELNGQDIVIPFNQADSEVLQEEQSILQSAKQLQSWYSDIKLIPAQEVMDNGFVRIKLGKKYGLFKRLTKGDGVVLYK